ncbi:carbohydrate ABC transporter permease [Actinoplanes regularis]|uniref:Carbohydrate ABC transporter membrane protein 1, CUT1 family n=1 Tax=Actinoplanes regularis TaxID=52697 RepID=A0A238W830_9ACTN|nr:sugar ABC transporter permease [Actinoplanes regularis]GIE85167.1 putative ABC transporter permease protein YurN [Actinoplanes regularis]GLW27356.1 putative ABC transporter permease protein YurN [Actinoplanes regularis]SNR42755.1 carbohydrate ABC transporter membrane protein 1, CUT1 family [Actinoplanes regularis]
MSRRALYLFAAPALALYGGFFLLPAVQGLRYATTDWDGYSPAFHDVGAANLTAVVSNDDLFRNALTNNLKFLLVVVLGQTALALLLAVLLAARGRGSTWLRALFFLPTVLSSVSVAFIWKFVYDPNFGLANAVLDAAGLDRFESSYLGDESTAILWVAVAQIWFHAGQMMIVYIAGINQIPEELYDAARTDGAGRWQQFRHVTWPMVAPATALVVAYTTLQSFKAFDLILGLAGNPPRSGLDVLATRIYSTFANSQLGYAAAESIVFMAAIAVVTFLQNRAARMAHG